MLISLEWLKEYVDIKEDVKELENALTMIGQEVEAITVQGKDLGNVVIGQVVEYGKHPNAEKLTLTKVDVGEGEPLQIVCGAPNHRLGDKVIVSKVGAVLPGDRKIAKTKIRGIESCGMICSEMELGIGNDAEGVVILPEDAPIGEEYRKYANLNDVIFELEITPNRPDCLSHIGIAREIAAYYGRKVKYPSFDVFETLEDVSNNVRIEIEDKERCKRFAGRVMRNITVKESPEWLKRRIKSMGLNPVNNIVDATNFVMFEYNQPIHTYDLSKIKDMTIVVRAAKKGEKLTTLMGDELELDGELVIADSEKPLSIAGVMGGLDSGITNETKDIFIEVAYFTPENIRRTGKKLGITSESGYRNERGTDIENVAEVLDRVTSLIYEIADGNIVGKAKDIYPVKFSKIEIPLDIKKFRKFMGKDIDAQEVAKILTNLGLEIKAIGQETAVVTPPSYRQDLTRSADLYEEIIRMYGFENIEAKMPVENITAGVKAEPIRLMDESKVVLAKIGLQEVINYSFIDKNVKDFLHIEDEVIMIKNPIAETMSMMRPSLVYSILTNIRENLNRNQDSLKIFEVAKVFKKAEELAQEDIHVAIGICGRDHRTLWNPKPEAYDFYMLKGYVEEYLELIGAKRYKLERTANPNFHPGRAADIKVGKVVVGTFGEIHPDVAEKMDIKKERAYVAEINLTLLKQYISKKFKYERIVKYPEVTRDLAVVLDDSVLVGDMIDMIKRSSDFIETVELFDIYKGEHIEAGKKSVAIGLTLRNKVGTLNEEDINKVIDKVLNIIRTKFAGEIRQ